MKGIKNRIKSAVILCAGAGTKIWPYAQIRSKAMIPVSNKPIVSYSVDILTEKGFDNIIIVAGKFSEEITAYFRDYSNVKVIVDNAPRGAAFSLLKAKDEIGNEDFLALYGDTIISEQDLTSLIESFENDGKNSVLAAPIVNRRNDHIGLEFNSKGIKQILGHPRDDTTHFFGGFAFKNNFFEALAHNSGRFPYAEVGMMVPVEGYIEATVGDELNRGVEFNVVEAKDRVYDIDKPWQIMEACREINERRCSALTQNELGEGTVIDPSASISGCIKTCKNCVIGKNVIIMGNIILGDDTKILNGALVSGNVVVGNNCSIRNCCFISGESTIGNDCIISHAAELDGVIFNRVYLYHYMEFFGIIGENFRFTYLLCFFIMTVGKYPRIRSL